jgi:hypothetical protein
MTPLDSCGTDENADRDSSPAVSHAKLVLFGFAIIGAILLVAEHRAHLLPFLPWLFLAACPLVHVLMHRGHHGHGRLPARDMPPSVDESRASPRVDDVARRP